VTGINAPLQFIHTLGAEVVDAMKCIETLFLQEYPRMEHHRTPCNTKSRSVIEGFLEKRGMQGMQGKEGRVSL
jgi:hypothetical protein